MAIRTRAVTLLAALVTVSWGGLAMIASIPINWFFTATVPHAGFVLLVNLVVFAGVGVAMSDVILWRHADAEDGIPDEARRLLEHTKRRIDSRAAPRLDQSR